MNKELFKETLVDELTKKGLPVKLNTTHKVNNIDIDCITLDITDKIIPTVKIDLLYEEYKKGKSLIEIINEAYDLLKTKPSFGMDAATNPSKIIPQLINRDINAELLNSVPHRNINEDMALIYRALVKEDDDFSASYVINNSNVMPLDMTEEELYNRAMSELEAKIYRMEDIIANITFGISLEPLNIDELEDSDNLMLVLGGKSSTYNAASILKPDVQAKLSRVYPNGYYVLPSSIHELIIVSKTNDYEDLDSLFQMVKEINESDVIEDDIFLANGVYEVKEGRLVKVA